MSLIYPSEYLLEIKYLSHTDFLGAVRNDRTRDEMMIESRKVIRAINIAERYREIAS